MSSPRVENCKHGEIATIFTMTRNEDHLIEDFIIYHGTLFGWHNIVIIDNCSDDEKVHAIYKKYQTEPYGITVVTEPNYTGEGQGQAFTKHMAIRRDSENPTQFLIGLDSDEFLFYKPDLDANVTCCPENIYAYLRKLLASGDDGETYFQIPHNYDVVLDTGSKHYLNQQIERPATMMQHFLKKRCARRANSVDKKFYRSDAFILTKNGNHMGQVSAGNCDAAMDTELGVLHFYHTGNRRQIQRAQCVCLGYGYTSLNRSIQQQIRDLHPYQNHCAGYHKVRDYLYFLWRRVILHHHRENNLKFDDEPELKRRALYHMHAGDDPNIFCGGGEIKDDDDDEEFNNRLYYDSPIALKDPHVAKCIYLSGFLQSL